MRTLLILVAFLFALPALHAQSTVPLEGTIVDAESGKPIGGATVRADEGRTRTYTSGSGGFRLPLAPGEHNIRCSSLGYRDTTIAVRAAAGMPRIEVRLQSVPLVLKGVEVNAGLTADQIIERAIDKKEENRRRAKTVQGLLYSKVSLRIDGNAFGQLKDEDRESITETFSRAYYSDRGPRIKVIQRRQTANIPAQSNLVALGNFISFYDDELSVLNARIPSPLNQGTLSRYEFTQAKRTSLNGETVWIIGVKPTTRLLPAFEGTITIAASNYNLIEVDLAPSKWTAIAFVHDLRLHQKFEKITEDIWQPTFLAITARANVTIVKGIAEIGADVSATSIFTQLEVNTPIPDSVYADEQIISAAPNADSARPEFWEGNSLSELSDKERDTYRRVDSMVATAGTGSPEPQPFNLGVTPWADFNRAGSLSLGATVAPSSGPVGANLFAAWSFGLDRVVYQADATVTLLRGADLFSADIHGAYFSTMATTTSDAAYPRVLNSVYAAFLHRDYYDHFRKDGWNAGFTAKYQQASLSGDVEIARHYSLSNSTSRSIFQHRAFRENPAIVEGEYRTATLKASWGRPENAIVISSAAGTDLRLSLTGLYGEHTPTATAFRSAEGRLGFRLATIPTGYSPMTLRVEAAGGLGSDNLPLEYQFRMNTSLAFIGVGRSFLSAPVGLYGGTRYGMVAGEHNFSDIVWRAFGLPTYEGRGIEISLSGAAGYFDNRAAYGYAPTGGIWYTEVGFGLGKIPTFISNVFYLGFDARWGIGPLGVGNFGMALNLTSPF